MAGMFKLTGDFAKLSRFQQKAAGAALPALRRSILDGISVKGQQQLDRGFDAARSPHRRKWKKRKRNYPWPILQKTLALRTGTTAKATRRGVSYGFKASYGKYHLRSRPFVPTKTIPKRWRGAYARIAQDKMREHFA
jgi:hypothetical protein